jgi:hypothetical protein
MYADGHLTTFEDDLLEHLLAAMGHTAELDRQREFDRAVTRIRPLVESIKTAKVYVDAVGKHPMARNHCRS